MLALTNVFKKHLKEYASRILLANLPKLSQQANVSTSAANLTSTLMTRDIKEISTQLQNFHTLLKEGEQIKLLGTIHILREHLLGVTMHPAQPDRIF